MFFVSDAHKSFYLLNVQILSGKKIRRLDDLTDIEAPGLRRFGELQVRVRLPLFVQEVLQYRFGIDPDEFFPQDAIQQVHVTGVDAVAVVHHGEVTDTFGIQPMDRPHHVSGIHRVNQVLSLIHI